MHRYRGLLRKKPTGRPTAEEILYHPYFALKNNATKIFFAKLLKDLRKPHPSTLIIILDLPYVCAWYDMQTKSDEHESKGKRKISHLLISEAIHYLCIFGKLMAVNFND